MTRDYLLSLFKKLTSSYLQGALGMSYDQRVALYADVDANIKDFKYMLNQNKGAYRSAQKQILLHAEMAAKKELAPEYVCVALHEIYHSALRFDISAAINEGYVHLNTLRTMLEPGNRHLPVQAGYFTHMVITSLLETVLSKEQMRDFARENDPKELRKAIDAVAGRVGYADKLLSKLYNMQLVYSQRKAMPPGEATEICEELTKNILSDMMINLCRPQALRIGSVSRSAQDNYVSEIQNNLRQIANASYINCDEGNRAEFLQEMALEVPKKLEKIIRKSEQEIDKNRRSIDVNWNDKRGRYESKIEFAFQKGKESRGAEAIKAKYEPFELAETGIYKTGSSDYHIRQDGDRGFIVSGGIYGKNERKFPVVLIDENKRIVFVGDDYKIRYRSLSAVLTPLPIREKLAKFPAFIRGAAGFGISFVK